MADSLQQKAFSGVTRNNRRTTTAPFESKLTAVEAESTHDRTARGRVTAQTLGDKERSNILLEEDSAVFLCGDGRHGHD
jgi:hypothetical protein